MSVQRSSNYVTGRVATRLRNGRNDVATGGGVVVGGGIDPSSLNFVPYDPGDPDYWAVPDKTIRAKEGLHSDKTITATGDIIARTPQAVVFAAADDAAGGSQYLYQLLDVDITNPVDGAMLVYDGTSQKWEDVDDFIIEGGQYSII